MFFLTYEINNNSNLLKDFCMANNWLTTINFTYLNERNKGNKLE